jgi:hypothetical protein
LLEDLREAARVRRGLDSRYRLLLARALEAGVSSAVIARYAGISPQAVNAARLRLSDGSSSSGLPDPGTVDEIVRKSRKNPQVNGRRRRNG